MKPAPTQQPVQPIAQPTKPIIDQVKPAPIQPAPIKEQIKPTQPPPVIEQVKPSTPIKKEPINKYKDPKYTHHIHDLAQDFIDHHSKPTTTPTTTNKYKDTEGLGKFLDINKIERIAAEVGASALTGGILGGAGALGAGIAGIGELSLGSSSV